ncbi:MAG: 5-formyltetrahydrofolate cyclo-ligase, partial [Nitrospirae bacterium]|nr:5-formyltetrahydrofolate cyclo-ligase [Nitrospirota bacterium]
KGKELELFEIKSFDNDVLPGAWGIPEPEGGMRVELKDIGLIVVPGAAFDEKGNRIGYGAGFYDKLLHDIPMQMIVTEKRVIDVHRQ